MKVYFNVPTGSHSIAVTFWIAKKQSFVCIQISADFDLAQCFQTKG